MRRILAGLASVFCLVAFPACTRSTEESPDDSAFRQITAVDPDELAAARKRVDELFPQYFRQSCEGSGISQCLADLEPMFADLEQAWWRYRGLFRRVDRANQLPSVVDKPVIHAWMNIMDKWISVQRKAFDRLDQCLAGREETEQIKRKCLAQLRSLIKQDAQLREEITRLSRGFLALVSPSS